jgi:hypothetical protein
MNVTHILGVTLLASTLAVGQGMSVARKTNPPSYTPLAAIDSLRYNTGTTPSLIVHQAGQMLATPLSDVDSIVFRPLPPFEASPTDAYSYDISHERIRYLNFGQVYWGPNWAWFGMNGTESVSMEAVRTVEGSTTMGGTSATVSMTHTARATGNREFQLVFALSVNQQVDGARLVSQLNLQSVFFGNGTVYAWSGGAIVDTVSTTFPRGSMSGSFDSLTIIASNGDTTLVWFDTPAEISCDNGARVNIGAASMQAGVTYTTTIHVRLPDELAFYPNMRATYQYGDTERWFAYPVADSGTPVDLSFLNKDNSGNFIPAGSHGFLRAEADSFVFEDGTPGRFWGVNLTAGAAKASDARILQLCERLSRLGVNVVRLHHLDSWWTASCIDRDHPDGTTQHLDRANMERLDKCIFELKRHGIHVVLDPWVGREFRAGDSVPGWEQMTGNFGLHPYVYFDARIQELTKLYWQQIWTHVNPYTGLAYKDDPAIILTEIINEGLPTGPDLEPYRTNYLAMYKAWARANGVDTNHNPISNNYDQKSINFYMHYIDSFYTTMYAYLRGIGVRVPITYNNWSFWNWDAAGLAGGDFMDMHHYYGGDIIGAGNQLGGVWAEQSIYARGQAWGKIAKHAAYNKPVMSSECGQNPPKIYRGAYYPSFAAISCFQGWDCITGYAYSQSGSPSRYMSGQFLGAYEWECDPATIAGLAAGALIFRRRDVSPAQQVAVMQVPRSEWYVLHWQNGGEEATENLPRLNATLEERRLVVVYGDTIPLALAGADILNVTNAFNYTHAGTQLRSDTDQLWRDWSTGIGTINTPRTQSAFGRLNGTVQATHDCSFTINNAYASVQLSSLDANPIATSGKLLLVATARAQNTGMGYDLLESKVVVTGREPIVAEPVTGTVSFATNKSSLTLYPIAVGGARRAGVSVPVISGTAAVELKAEYQTLFYEIE